LGSRYQRRTLKEWNVKKMNYATKESQTNLYDTRGPTSSYLAALRILPPPWRKTRKEEDSKGEHNDDNDTSIPTSSNKSSPNQFDV